MKSLQEHEAEKRESYKPKLDGGKARKNNIECPTCKDELWDTDPSKILASYPPKLNVNCTTCGYTGFRTV